MAVNKLCIDSVMQDPLHNAHTYSENTWVVLCKLSSLHRPESVTILLVLVNFSCGGIPASVVLCMVISDLACTLILSSIIAQVDLHHACRRAVLSAHTLGCCLLSIVLVRVGTQN